MKTTIKNAVKAGNVNLVMDLVASLADDEAVEAIRAWPIAMLDEFCGCAVTHVGDVFVVSDVRGVGDELVAVTLTAAQWLAIVDENADALDVLL